MTTVSTVWSDIVKRSRLMNCGETRLCAANKETERDMSVFNTCRWSRNKPSNSGRRQRDVPRLFATRRKWKRATRKVNYGRTGDQRSSRTRCRPTTNGRFAACWRLNGSDHVTDLAACQALRRGLIYNSTQYTRGQYSDHRMQVLQRSWS